MKKLSHGFTLVELVIVIGVIGILSGIAVFGWDAAIENSRTSSRATEMEVWRKSFELYKSRFATYPDVATGTYCLGKGFPSGKCGKYTTAGPRDVGYESNSTTLMSQLQRVSPVLPKISVPPTKDWIGPYVEYTETSIEISAIFRGDGCPAGTLLGWTDAGLHHCYYLLNR